MKEFYMAPMEGVTTDAYRRAYHKNFKPFHKYFTPFIVPYEKGRFAIRELREIDPERNKGMFLIPQILTNQSEGFLHTTKLLQAFGYEEVNLNLGCPSKTVAGKGRGSGFLALPDELDKFLYEIYDQAEVRISLKTRIGKENVTEFERLLAIYEKYPVSELIIHPRVMTDYYKNVPNLEAYEYAVEKSDKNLVYNGDINEKKDLERLMRRIPLIDKVMIGRGIIRNPFLLEEIDGSKSENGLTDKERCRLKNFHYDLVENYREICRTEKNLLYKMKEIWMYMSGSFVKDQNSILMIRRAQDIKELNKEIELILS